MNDKLKEIYDGFLENDQPPSSKETRDSYSSMIDAFEKYLVVVEEDMFYSAFTFGYEQGMKDARKIMAEGGARHE